MTARDRLLAIRDEMNRLDSIVDPGVPSDAAMYYDLAKEHMPWLCDEVERLEAALRTIRDESGAYDEEPPSELPSDHPIVRIYECAEAALTESEPTS